VFHGVGKLYFGGRRLIPDRCGDIIDCAPLIGPIEDESSVKKIELCYKSWELKLLS